MTKPAKVTCIQAGTDIIGADGFKWCRTAVDIHEGDTLHVEHFKDWSPEVEHMKDSAPLSSIPQQFLDALYATASRMAH